MASRVGRHSGRIVALGVAVALLGVLTVVDRASGQETQASVIGTVSDESQAVIPGVTVTATSPALQGSRTAVTDAQGQYRINPLPIGTYTLLFELPGFRTLRREDIRLTAGFTARIDIAMSVGALEETVTVSGAAPVVDATSTAATTVLTRETLDLIPTARTGYNAILAQAPGARETLQALSPTTGAAFRAFGQSNQAYQAVDGVITATPQLSQSGQYIDFTVFEEAVISTLGHDASIPTRGIAISTVIKTGGNNFHGRAFVGYTNATFQANNVGPDLEARGVGKPNELDLKDDWNGELGGRILRDKLWFWGQARWQRDRTLTQDCYQREAPFIGPALQTSGEQCFEWQRAYYQTTKETWKISTNNTLNGMLMNVMRRDNEGADQAVAWERRRKQWNVFSPTTKVEWQSVQGQSRTMSLMAGVWVNRSGGWGEEFADGATPARDRSTGYSWGTQPTIGERQHVFRRNVRWGMDWYKPDWVGGSHAFKIGADYFHAEGNRARNPRKAPTYELVFNNYPKADTIEVQNTPVYPTGRIITFAPYIQDAWTLSKKLILNVGVRYAYDNGKTPATCREAANPPGDVANPAQCFPDIQYPIYHSLAPRLRFTYDFTGSGRTLLKGGWGRYMLGRWGEEINTANKNVIQTTSYTWHDNNGNAEYDPGEVNLDPNCVAGPGVVCDFIVTSFSGQTAALANGIVNPDQTQPWTDEYMVQFEHELRPGWGVRLTGIQSRVLNWYRYENSLRPYGVYTIPVTNFDPGPDNILNTADDPGTQITYYEYPTELRGLKFQAPWIVNDPAANKRYTSFEIAASKRLANRWSMQSSFSYTKIHDPLPVNTAGGTAAFEANTKDPNAEIFAADNTTEWQGRLSGSYMMPWAIQLSANYQARSGNYWARTAVFRDRTPGATIPSITLRVEPRDAHQFPTIHLTDFRVEKRLHLGGSKNLALRFNVFNLFNANTVTAIRVASGATFNQVSGYLRARLGEFNVVFDF